MNRQRPTLMRLFLAFGSMSMAAPVEAATGLASLEGLAWVLGFFALVALAGLVVFVLYLRKYLGGRADAEQKPGFALRVVALILLFLGAPVFLMAFSARELSIGWLLIVIGYLAVLAVTLIDFVGHKKIVLAATALVIPLYIIQVSGVVTLTRVTIVDNRPFEASHELEARLSGRYFRTTDGGLYRMDRRTLPREDLLPVGSQLHIERIPGAAATSAYRVKYFGKSRDYFDYERRFVDPWITIPLHRVRIERYQTGHVGRVGRLDGTDWRAEDRDMSGAAVSNCCNADWFREMIAHGVDPRGIRIGERNLLHVIANNMHRSPGAVETAAVLIDAGVDIEARDAQGQTPLFVAVESFEYSYSQKPELAERFTGYIRLLLEAGADPDGAANYQFTPILEAVIGQRYGVARMLLQYGADPTIESTTSQSGYSRAVRALKILDEGEHNDELQRLVREMEARMQ